MTDPRDRNSDSERISGEHDVGSHRTEDDGVLGLTFAHRAAILTCMDSRIDSAKLVGARGRRGDVQVIRNAGGRATEDAIRSLVFSYQLFGTRAWYVVQHSHCGMALLTEDLARDALQQGPRAKGLKIGVPAAREGGSIHKLALRDQEQSLLADIAKIRNHPLVPADVELHGYMFHVDTGRFVEVRAAIEAACVPGEVRVGAQEHLAAAL
jgi:carbonic anhydrase